MSASPSIPNPMASELVTNYSGGNVFWVRGTNHALGAGTNDQASGTRKKPFATIDFAVGRCTANQGDIIMVMPGYVQTITATGGITFDVAGIRVIGLGNANDQPTLTHDNANSDISITAADVVIENFIHVAGVADVTGPVRVTGLGAVLLNHNFRDDTATDSFQACYDIAGTDRACDYLRIENSSYMSVDVQADNFILIANDVHYLVMKDCAHWSHSVATVEFMQIANGASLFGALIQRVYTHNLDVADVVALIVHGDQTDHTGIIADCFSNHRDTAGELLIPAAANSFQFIRCRGSGVIDTQGYTLPTVDAV